MKAVHRASYILKVTGTVLIILSLVLGLYALINTGAAKGSLNQGMDRFGAADRMTDNLAFDRAFFGALSKSAGNMNRNEDVRMAAIENDFRSWFRRAEEAVRSQEEDLQRGFAGYMMTQTPESLKLDKLDEQQENREIREMLEYIDNLAAPPKKGKAAALKPASQELVLRDFHTALTEEHGEEAGNWFEFVSSVFSMLKDSETAGSPIKDIRGWLGSLTFEAYQPVLEAVRTEEKSGSADSISDALNTLYREHPQPTEKDFLGFLNQTAATLKNRYPGDNLGGDSTDTLLAIVLPELLKEENGFDGSYGAVAEKVRELAETEGDNTVMVLAPGEDGTYTAQKKSVNTLSAVRKWEQDYLRQVLAEADNRKDITVVGTFWTLVSVWVWMLLAGIMLIILSVVIRKLLSRYLLKHRKDAGIQEDPDVLLRVEHLKQYFRSGPAVTKAVDDVSFFIRKGEVFGLVGESGCGKTTTGRTIINLYDPTEGDVYFNGLKISSTQNGLPVLKADIRSRYQAQIAAAKKAGDAEAVRRLKAERKEALVKAEDRALESSVEKSKCVQFYRERRLKELKDAYDADMKNLSGAAAEERTRKYETERKVAAKDNVMTRMQMIFQDPIASINPRMTVREIIAEGLIIRGVRDKEYINQKVYEMLELVGLVREHADRYPHEFSGGQRQRIGIARAIIMEPDLIIADEPISALDVSIQAQVINLLNDLRQRMGLTIMFIAHNLSVVKYFSDRIAVMYFGKIVELTTSDELFAHPLHPYTKSLLSAIPYPDPHYEKNRKRIEYVPAKVHDYSVDKPSLREITPGHYIHCNDAEFKQYLKELGR